MSQSSKNNALPRENGTEEESANNSLKQAHDDVVEEVDRINANSPGSGSLVRHESVFNDVEMAVQPVTSNALIRRGSNEPNTASTAVGYPGINIHQPRQGPPINYNTYFYPYNQQDQQESVEVTHRLRKERNHWKDDCTRLRNDIEDLKNQRTRLQAEVDGQKISARAWYNEHNSQQAKNKILEEEKTKIEQALQESEDEAQRQKTGYEAELSYWKYWYYDMYNKHAVLQNQQQLSAETNKKLNDDAQKRETSHKVDIEKKDAIIVRLEAELKEDGKGAPGVDLREAAKGISTGLWTILSRN
ncbi:hypothetical protein IQ06DRAFT_124217 [Phaeosphaeriaceae sp. SRC1lsM3a]|nr:hypothetical protein IQ06DRAFT_124217 [Stagonospora sp. SRC1lsM3a]